jgi:hypothetical protein
MPSGHEKAYANWLAFITNDPELHDILEYHFIDEAQARVRILQDALQRRELTPSEQEEMDVYIQLEFLIQTAKLDALVKLDRKSLL